MIARSLPRVSLVIGCIVLLGHVGAPRPAEAGRKFVVGCTTCGCCEAKLAECHRKVAGLQQDITRLKESLGKCELERRCLAEKLHDTEADRDRIQGDLDRVTERLREMRQRLELSEAHVERLRDRVHELRQELESTKDKLESTSDKLAETERDLDDARDKNSQLAHDLDRANDQIQALQSRLDRREAWFWALLLIAALLLILLLFCLWAARFRTWKLHDSVDDAHDQHERDVARISELGNRYAAAKSRMKAYKRQVDDLRHSNYHLHGIADEHRTHRYVAEQPRSGG